MRYRAAVSVTTASLAVAAVLLLFPPWTYAEIPGASDSKVVTEHNFRAALLDYNRRTSVETYKQVGHRDPKWDEPAVAFLEAMARYFANSGVATRYRFQPVATLEELEAQGRAVLALGCDDPLVIYSLAAVLDNQDEDGEARPLLQKVLDELPNSRYPVNRLSAVADRMLKHYDPGKVQAAYAKCEQLMLDATLAAISVADFRGLDRRAVWFVSRKALMARSLPVRKKFCDDAKAIGADPWLVNMFEGAYHLAAAYDVPPTPQGRRITDAHWRLASTCFIKAWKLEPSYPEPAGSMILLAMRPGRGGQRETPRVWFERTVTAQFDYKPAYSHYVEAVSPQWGGSHDEMLAFALECAATKRYDTRVPNQMLDAIEVVLDAQGGSPEAVRALWRRPGVYDAAANALRAYAERPEEQSRRDWYHSYHMSVAMFAGRYDDAAAVRHKAGGEIVWVPVDEARGIAPRLNHHIHAMTGTRAGALREAEEAVDAKQLDAALKTYEAALTELPPKDPSIGWVNHRLAELRLLKQFEVGDWVELQPPGPHLFGWYSAGGKWAVDAKGGLVGTSQHSGLHLVCGAEFGARYELTGTLEYVSVGNVPDPAAGPILRYSRDAESHGLWLRKGAQQAVVRMPTGEARSWPAEVRDSNELRVQVWNGRTSGWVNGQPAFDNHLVPPLAGVETTRVGVGGQYNYGNETIVVRFSNLKIRKLSKPPAVRDSKQPHVPPRTREKRDGADL